MNIRKNINKKTLQTILSLLLWCSLFRLALNVSSGSSELIVGNDSLADFLTIQDAIDAAQPGDTILVGEGVFFEQLTINKTLKLLGNGHEKTIIDGKGKGTVIEILNVKDVMIEGFKIKNSALQTPYGGIVIKNSRNIIIANNNITMNTFGIFLENVSNSRIEGNIVKRNYESAITLDKSNNNKISNNTVIYNTPYGIYLHCSKDNIVNKNYVAYICQGIRIENSSNNHIIRNYLEKNSPYGISIINSSDNSVKENFIINNNFGVYLADSKRNLLEDNMVAFQPGGLYIHRSTSNVFRNNSLNGNWLYNFGIRGYELSHFIHIIEKTNTINGKPIYYLIGEINVKVPEEAGFVAIVNSSRVIVENLNLTGNMQGIVLVYSKEVIVRNSIIYNNFGEGIYFQFANNCQIEGNTIKGNMAGVRLEKSTNNTFFHNNFINNKQHVEVDQHSRNFWDSGYPRGGNYWSDYKGNDSNSDGVGDVSYWLHEGNIDRFPLTGKTYEFLAFENKTLKQTIKIISNVTISSFRFNREDKILEFTIKANKGKSGFCRIEVSKTLLETQNMPVSNWIAKLNNQMLETHMFEGENFTYIYFQFTANETVQICQIILGKEGTLDLIPIIMIFSIAMIIVGTLIAFAVLRFRAKSLKADADKINT
jgi:parallel beta-helix repeat protein